MVALKKRVVVLTLEKDVLASKMRVFGLDKGVLSLETGVFSTVSRDCVRDGHACVGEGRVCVRETRGIVRDRRTSQNRDLDRKRGRSLGTHPTGIGSRGVGSGGAKHLKIAIWSGWGECDRL